MKEQIAHQIELETQAGIPKIKIGRQRFQNDEKFRINASFCCGQFQKKITAGRQKDQYRQQSWFQVFWFGTADKVSDARARWGNAQAQHSFQKESNVELENFSNKAQDALVDGTMGSPSRGGLSNTVLDHDDEVLPLSNKLSSWVYLQPTPFTPRNHSNEHSSHTEY